MHAAVSLTPPPPAVPSRRGLRALYHWSALPASWEAIVTLNALLPLADALPPLQAGSATTQGVGMNHRRPHFVLCRPPVDPAGAGKQLAPIPSPFPWWSDLVLDVTLRGDFPGAQPPAAAWQ